MLTTMTAARRRTAAATAGLLMLAGCTGSEPKRVTIDSVRAVDPSVAALSPDAKLDRSLSLSGMRGVLQGTVGNTAGVTTLAGGAVVSLTDFLITGRFGFATHDAAAYLVGQHTELAVPGGRTATTTTVVEDAPTLHPGEQIFVYVQTKAGGQRFLGLPASDIVLDDESAVAVLNASAGTVTWDNFTEPAATFEHHFISHPASG